MTTGLYILGAFALGSWVGCKVGFAACEFAWIENMREHGWEVADENNEPCEPTQMYGDHWYD